MEREKRGRERERDKERDRERKEGVERERERTHTLPISDTVGSSRVIHQGHLSHSPCHDLCFGPTPVVSTQKSIGRRGVCGSHMELFTNSPAMRNEFCCLFDGTHTSHGIVSANSSS